MPSLQLLKGRIRSVRSTRQITKAMQLISAAKMRKAQEATKASAPYVTEARKILNNMAHHISTKNHPLFNERPIKNRLIILIAADRGLAGAFNSNVMRLYTQELQKNDGKTKTITIGRRAGQFVARLKGVDVLGSYENLPDTVDGSELSSIMNSVRNLFTSKDVDAVDIIYTEFVSSVKQDAKVVRILPAGLDETTTVAADVTYEPSSEEVLDAVAYRLVEAEIFQALLDSRASEHVMRMVAMKNATDNANDLIDDLTLEVNKARQGNITQELAEISGGVEALNA